MDIWPIVVGGLVLVPILGMVAVGFDAVSAHADYVRVSDWYPDSVEEEQAKHTLYAQIARFTSLSVIATMATLELADILNRDGIALLLYVLALVLVADAFRAYRARKRMVAMIEATEDEAAGR